MTEITEQPPQKKLGSGLAAVLILGVATACSSFATVYLLTPTSAEESEVCEAGEHSIDHAKPLVSPDQTYVELPEVTITIGRTPATRYLKIKLVIITEKPQIGLVHSAEPVLIDAFVSYLRSVELNDFEDPGFYTNMRQQLSRRSELVLGNKASNGVLITEFLLR